MNNPPRGYLQVDHNITEDLANKIRHSWRNAMERNETPVLGSGVKFVSLEERSPLDPVIVQCGHCTQWGARQTECRHCGAPIF